MKRTGTVSAVVNSRPTVLRIVSDLQIVLAIAVMYATAVLCYLFHYQYQLSILLWLGFALSIAAMLTGTLASSGEAVGLVSVLLFYGCLAALSIFRTNSWGYTFYTDASHNLQLSILLNDLGAWKPGMGFEREVQYSFFPASNLWAVTLGQVTDLDLTALVRFVSPLLTGMSTLGLFYVAVRSILSKKVALFALLVVLCDPIFVWKDGAYIPEAYGLVFYAMFLAALFSLCLGRRREHGWIVIAIFSSLGAVISHHWSSYNLVLIAIVFVILPGAWSHGLPLFRGGKRQRGPELPRNLVFAVCVIVFSWLMFVALDVLTTHSEWGVSFLLSLLHPFSEHVMPGLEGAAYGLQDRVLIVLGALILVVFGLAEFLSSVLRRQKAPSEYVLLSWFAFAAFYAAIVTFLAPKSLLAEIVVTNKRTWPFAFLGLAPLISRGISRANMKMGKTVRTPKHVLRGLAPLILILPLVSMILQGPVYVRDSTYPMPSSSYYDSAMWAKSKVSGVKIAMDFQSETVFGPYGQARICEFANNGTRLASDLVVYEYQNMRYSVPNGCGTVILNRDVRIVTEARATYDWYANPSLLPALYDQGNKIYAGGPISIYQVSV
jgi:hypothetical protein